MLLEDVTVIRTFNNEEVKRMVSFYKRNRFLDLRNKLMITLMFLMNIVILLGVKIELLTMLRMY